MNKSTEKEQLWSSQFILICICTLLFGICMQMLNSNLAPFAEDTFQSSTIGGYLTTVFTIGSIIMAFFSGRLTDVKGRRNCLIIGSLLFGLPTFACAIWPTVPVSLTVRFLEGIGKGIYVVAASAVVADIIPKSRMSEGMGYYGLSTTVTMAFGPMLALALTASGNYAPMFIVCAVCFSSVSVISLALTYEKKQEYQTKRESDRQRDAAINQAMSEQYPGVWKLIEKKAILPSLNFTIAFAGYSAIVIFITAYAKTVLELPNMKVSLFYTVAAAAIFVVRLLAGKIADRRGAVIVLIPAHICIIAMFLILIFFAKEHYWMFLLSGVLYGMGNAAMLPTLQAVAVVDSPAGRNGTASATFMFMQDFGMLIASAVFGPIIDSAAIPADGYHMVFYVSIAILIFSGVMSTVCFNNKARAKRKVKI